MVLNLIVLLNHRLTKDQIDDAHSSLKVKKIIYPEDKVKNIWSNIPVEKEGLCNILKPVFRWIKDVSNQEDYILIQGDFGATYLVVRFAMLNCLIPIYAKTQRIVKEKHLPTGEVKIEHIFLHKGFRIYGI